MTPEEIRQVVEDYKKSSKTINEQSLINFDALRNLRVNEKDKYKPNGAQGAQGGENKIDKSQNKNNDNVGTQGGQGPQSSENTVKDNSGLDLKGMEKYSNPNRKEITMKDFASPPPKPTNPSGKVIPKPKKPLMKNSPAAKAGIPIETRQKFANQNAAFQATKNKDSGYNKMDFIKDFPNSQTAKKFNKGEPIPGFSYKKNLKNSYEPYHIVLGYVLSEGHAETVEEAHYVMSQMDGETIQEIVALDEAGVANKIMTGAALTLGGMGLNAIRKMLQNKQKMDQDGKFTPGSTMDNIQKKNQMLKDL